MTKSKLETLNQKILKALILKLYKKLLNDDYENPTEYDLSEESVYDSVESVVKTISVSNESIDIDFLFALYSDNFDLIDDEKIESDLVLPQIGRYSFEIDVDERVYQTVTYRHSSESYSQSNVIPLARMEEERGYFSIWDGNQVDTTVHDADTTDISWDYGSLEKIK